MTLPAQTLKNLYLGNGSTKSFAYTFKCLDADNLAVFLIDAATGVKTRQTQGTHYSVSGVGTDAGGSVLFINAPTSAQKVFLTSETPLEQNTAYVEGDKFPAKSHEAALDNLMRIAQERKGDTDRCLKTPAEDNITLELPNATARANKFLYFDETGQLATGDPGNIVASATAARDAAIAAQTAAENSHIAAQQSADASLQSAVDSAASAVKAQSVVGSVRVSDADTTPGRLSAKIVPGDGVEVSVQNIGADENMLVKVSKNVLSVVRILNHAMNGGF